MTADDEFDLKRRGTWPIIHELSLPQQQSEHPFRAHGSTKDLERLKNARKDEGVYGTNLTVLYLGIAASINDNDQITVAFSSSDGTYNVDFAVQCLDGTKNTTSRADMIANHFITSIRNYSQDHFYKFAGAGIAKSLAEMSPNLCSRLWADLDIVPLVFERGLEEPLEQQPLPLAYSIDGEADSMARKCLMFFGPTQQPRIQIGYRNRVEVDVSGHAQLTAVDDYQRSVHPETWAAAMKYVGALKERKVKIAFFSSTPLGGGVSLMRHALMRFFRIVGVDCKWFVPKPKPEVFRVTKTNHNILQGVAKPEERLSKEQQKLLADWVEGNTNAFWLSNGGSLLAPSAGGADVIVVDDPQMPDLVRIAKQQDPNRPVIFRSHIQIRSDLADQAGTPTSEVWQWLWDRVQSADVFVSHPVREFVPSAVDFKKVGYMPATTDWLDGLNKQLSTFDTEYYIHEFNTECYKQRMTKLAFPARPYIVQIARFDPSKGIPDVLASYAELRHTHMRGLPAAKTPQLVLAGHGAVDDPDASLIYDQTLELLDTTYAGLRGDVVVMRVGPTDQLLNVLLANARVALQLSTREGFEIKVSEALHKGIPVVASRAGGIPLQVVHGKGGYLVESGDYKAVAKHLYDLFTDEALYREMSAFAAAHVSDEVGTVGNALAWMYLADALSRGETVRPDSAWINDLAREGAGVPYGEGETRLPRDKRLNLD